MLRQLYDKHVYVPYASKPSHDKITPSSEIQDQRCLHVGAASETLAQQAGSAGRLYIVIF